MTCFFCDKEFELNEIFIAFTRNEDGDGGALIHCECLSCAEQRLNNKKEKNGFWLILKRELDGYEVMDKPLNYD